MNYLMFRLYGPMASWGEIAVGETRHTAGYPSKSAIIGLLAAALGIKRDNTDKQLQMQTGYAVAVMVYSHGTLLRDYHTAQVPNSSGKCIYRTRRDEIVIGKKWLGTILSSREYRSDALALVAVKELPNALCDLSSLKEHLKKPKFHLYLGRKSCPLAAPINPQIIRDKNNYYEAFQAYRQEQLLPNDKPGDGSLNRRDSYWLRLTYERHYYWEGDAADFTDSLDLSRMQTRTRHDQPHSRQRWQFSPRQEHYFYCSGGE